MNIHLTCIDAQNDFVRKMGALGVPGGEENAKRVAAMIERLGPSKLTSITTTMDSHRRMDISHPLWWIDEHGRNPDKFTPINPEDMESGRWRTSLPRHHKRTLDYLKQLKARKRYPHVIWPEHCLFGDEGHNIFPPLLAAIHEWEAKKLLTHEVVLKGSNPYTEHFSAVMAEVPDAEDITTQVNTAFVESHERADISVWTGEALSHCLANTVRDTVTFFKDPSVAQKMVILTDATSNVPGFEKLGEDFLNWCKTIGIKLSTTTDFLA